MKTDSVTEEIDFSVNLLWVGLWIKACGGDIVWCAPFCDVNLGF